MDIERAGDVQLFGDLLTDALDATHGLDIQLLRRELDRRIAGVYTRKLDVLTDRIHHDLAMISHSIHLYLLGMFDELANHHGMLLADIRRQLQEALQLLLVRADIHGGTTQHIAGANQDGEAHLRHETIDVLHRGEFLPTGLIDTDPIQHSGELLPILGVVDALGRRTQDVDMLLIQTHR